MHRRFGVEHALIHIDIDDLRTRLNLLSRHIESCRVIPCFNQFSKPSGSCDIGALTHIYKQSIWRDVERLQPRQTTFTFGFSSNATFRTLDRLSNQSNMLRGRAATAADHVQ